MKIGYKKSPAEGLVTLLQGIDEGVQRYAQGRRYNEARADQNQERDRSYGLRLQENARQNEAMQIAQDREQRYAESQKAQERRASDKHPLDMANAQADLDWKQQRLKVEREEEDSWRQIQAQEYRRITGEDPPDSVYGPPPPEQTSYDVRSDVPIGVQQQVRSGMSEIAAMPPGATRTQKLAALKADAQKAARDEHVSALQADIDAHTQPQQQDANAEANPLQFLPPDQAQKFARQLADPKTNLDTFEGQWQKAKKANADKLAAADARMMAISRVDTMFQKFADRDAQFGDLGGGVDPMAFERARSLRYMLEGSNLSGDALRALEEKIYSELKAKPGGGSDVRTKAIANAKSMAGVDEKGHAKPFSEQDVALQQGMLTGKVEPRTDPGYGAQWPKWMQQGANGSPNPPEVQAKAAQAVEKALLPTPATRAADVKANPEKYRGRFKTKAELDAWLENGG